MKKRFFLITILLTIFAVCTSGNRTATAYTIDGLVDDWGIDLSSATFAGYLDTNLPSGGLDIDCVTEDNADSRTEWTRVGPLWSYYNYFDAEAIYFDNDQLYAYIAVVQGLPQAGYDPPGNTAYGNPDYAFKPGDIFIDADNNDTYEYGIDIETGSLMNVTSYENVYYDGGSDAYPWRIADGSVINSVPFVYSDEQNTHTHYVLEARILLSDLGGLSANPGDPIQPLTIHWAQECGNDYLNLDADINPVPEPATMLLLGTGLIGLAGLRRRMFRKNC